MLSVDTDAMSCIADSITLVKALANANISGFVATKEGRDSQKCKHPKSC